MGHYVVPAGGEHSYYRSPDIATRVNSSSTGQDRHSPKPIVNGSKPDLKCERDRRENTLCGVRNQILRRPGRNVEPDTRKDSSSVELEKTFTFGSTDIRYRELGARPKEKTVMAVSKESSKASSKGNSQTSKESKIVPAAEKTVDKKRTKVQFDLPENYTEKEVRTKLKWLCPTVVPCSESLTVKETDHFVQMKIATVVTSPRLPVRSGEADVLTHNMRKYLWASTQSPPVYSYPQTILFFSQEGDEFGHAIEDLLNQNRIRLSAVRVKSNCRWRIKYLTCATDKKVYMFDLEKFGINLFRWGLWDLFDDKDREFIGHNLDVVRNILEEDFNILVHNVFDTLGAYAMAVPFFMDKKITHRIGLRTVVRELLGVEDNHLPAHHPLDARSMHDLIMNVARETMYLEPLYHELLKALLMKSRIATKALITEITQADDEEARMMIYTPQIVLKTVSKKCLPLYMW